MGEDVSRGNSIQSIGLASAPHFKVNLAKMLSVAIPCLKFILRSAIRDSLQFQTYPQK